MERARHLDEVEAFVASHGPALFRQAVLMTGDLADAADLYQDAMVRLIGRWQRDGPPDQPERYARRVVTNLAVDRRRWFARHPHSSGADPPGAAKATVASPEEGYGRRDEVLGAMRSLGRRQRAAVVLRYWHDLSDEEIADTLGCSVGTVKSQVSRAVSHLRRHIEEVRTP